MSDVTQILSQLGQGRAQATDALLPLVYDELRKLASARLARERPGQTLSATSLVHEAYLRLVVGGISCSEGPVASKESVVPDSLQQTAGHWQNRGHFFAAAAEAMRRILVELARHKQCQKKGGDWARHDLLDVAAAHLPLNDQLLDLDGAISQLAKTDPQSAELVKLRIFAGMTVDEAALALNISPRTAKRDWAFARAWLGRQLAAYHPAKS